MERFYAAFNEIIEHLQKAKDNVNKEEVEKLIDAILTSKKIFCYGAGRSGFMARAFAQRLMHIGFEAYFLGETITPAMGKGDLLVAVSGSGETASTVCLARKAKDEGASVAAITTRRDGALARVADIVVVVLGKTKLVERESYAPFTSLFDITVLTLFDSVSAEIMLRKGVGEDLILERHATVE